MFGGCADCECGVSAIVGFARNDLGGGWGKSEVREEKSGLWTRSDRQNNCTTLYPAPPTLSDPFSCGAEYWLTIFNNPRSLCLTHEELN